MNCFRKHKVNQEVFDLMDRDGDNRVTDEELRYVAGFVQNHAVLRAQAELRVLKNSDSVEHLQRVLGKKVLRLRDIAKIKYMVPSDVWQYSVLPGLKTREIERLKS